MYFCRHVKLRVNDLLVVFNVFISKHYYNYIDYYYNGYGLVAVLFVSMLQGQTTWENYRIEEKLEKLAD